MGRLSWMIRVGPMSSQGSSDIKVRKGEESKRWLHKKDSSRYCWPRRWRKGPQAKGCRTCRSRKRQRNRFSFQASGRNTVLPIPLC